MTTLHTAPRREPNPMAIPFIALWLADARGRYLSTAVEDSPRLIASLDPTGLSGLVPGSVVFGIDGTIYGVPASGVPTAQPSHAAANTWALTQTFTLGIVNNGALDQNAAVDMDVTLAGATGNAFDLLAQASHATGTVYGAVDELRQLTNAKTAGISGARKVKTTGIAGDTSGATYGGLIIDADDGGGSGLHYAILALSGADLDAVINGAALLTGQNRWLVPDNAAEAIGIFEGVNAYLVVNTSNSGAFMDFGNATTNPTYRFLGSGGLTLPTGTVTQQDGTIFVRAGTGTGTGDVVDVIGPDATHGLQTVVFEAVISPAAIETAVLTLPTNHIVLSTQMNIESALTGGGTTVSASLGITGDVDAYGTMGNPNNQLTKNSKGNWMQTASGAGASIGIFSGATVGLKLIAAASGGASAGDTALTVGSVRVKVVYQVLASIADAP